MWLIWWWCGCIYWVLIGVCMLHCSAVDWWWFNCNTKTCRSTFLSTRLKCRSYKIKSYYSYSISSLSCSIKNEFRYLKIPTSLVSTGTEVSFCGLVSFDFIWSTFPIRTVQQHLDIIKVLFIHQLMHQWVVLKNNIKIYIKTAPTCFGVTVTPSSGSALICAY